MMNTKELLYYNGFGGFEKESLNYIVCTDERSTPLPWSHIIANEKFGTIVTTDGGGYTWSGNSRENKITSWSNDVVTNKPSESIFLLYDNKKVSAMPRDNLNEYVVRFGFGFAEFVHEIDFIESVLTVFVPIDRKEKIYLLNLKNKSGSDKCLDVSFFAEPVLGVDREYTKKHIKFKEVDNGIVAQNNYRSDYGEESILFGSDKFAECEVWNQSISVNSKILIKGNEEETIIFKIAVCDEDSKDTNYFDELSKVKNFWREKLNKIKVDTPLASLNIMMNGWLEYQTLVSRLWGRTSFYQAGGAFGFRDQLQDVLMLVYTEPEIARRQILYHAKHQFKEGDVLHWWHPERDNGVRTRCTDDYLWLPYVIAQYVTKTGDRTILDELVPYVIMDELKENESDRYEVPRVSEEKESLYMHCIRAIERSLEFGENGIPNIGAGDWNDGMNNIKGQSVWLGFFLADVLKKMIPICENKNDLELAEKYKGVIEKLKDVLNTTAWDGKWFKRAFFENGESLGSSQNDECKIDGISQSWAVISGLGEYQKCVEAMDSLDRNLVDKENMLIKLLTPAFSKSIQNPGYIKAYKEGVRENGGQYTHGAIWSLLANGMLNNKKRVYEYYKILNPIEHARTKENALKYKVEPYVIAADVYSSQGMVGRGGWTWYTGSASWFYVATLEYLLGFKIENGEFVFNPNLPDEWEQCFVRYNDKNTEYEIAFYNKGDLDSEIKIYANNQEINGNKVPLGLEAKEKIDIMC